MWRILLVLILVAASILSNISCKEDAMKERHKYLIPQGIVGVVFSNQEGIPLEDISYQEAKKIKTESDDKWFFREFDQNYLIFFTARYEPNPVKFKRPWGTYVTENIYRVRRSKEAEESLGVSEIVQFYEIGKRGIKGAMTEDEVVAVLGKPKEVEELGPFGSFDYVYDGFKVRFLDDRVALINE